LRLFLKSCHVNLCTLRFCYFRYFTICS